MIDRRTLLTGLGATAAGLALSPAWVRQALATGGAPCRFVFVIEGNSCEPTGFMTPVVRALLDAQATGATGTRRWFPNLYGHGSPIIETHDDLSTADFLSPLAASAHEPLDLTTRAAVVLGLSSKITGGGHSTYTGALSCTRSASSVPAGQTIDSVLANAVGALTPFDAIRLGAHGKPSALSTSTCAFAKSRPAPVLMNPERAFTSIFGAFADDPTLFEVRSRKLEFARVATDRRISAFVGPEAERDKLIRYHQSILDLVDRQVSLESVAAHYDPHAAGAMVLPATPDLDPRYTSTAPLEQLEMQFEIATAALQGGLTNVAVLGSGIGGIFDINYSNLIAAHPNIDAAISRHDLQHGSGGNPDFVSLIHHASRTHVEMVAKMARVLANTPEGTGSMLDNTLIVYMSDNGEQHHSKAEEWPLLLVGGNGMGFHTDGRTVAYPGINSPNNRQMSNFYNTLGHAAGLQLNDFGAEGRDRIIEGPLAELRS